VTIEILLQLLAAVVAGAGVYAAIRADLTRAIITAERAEKDAWELRGRLDNHLEHHPERRAEVRA